MDAERPVSLDAALQAQSALRTAAGLGSETFSIESFVGMVSDEIEQLRALGCSDADIAQLIKANSPIKVSAEDIAEHYAPPEARHSPD